MKKYKVNVNGNEYEIAIELMDETAAAPAPQKAPEAVKETVAPKAAVPQGEGSITAPMPGNILEVNVKSGDTVKKGDVLIILEAMKMENEIMAPADGTVASVNVTKGETVETGAVLCVIA